MKLDNMVKGLLLLIVILLFVSIITQQNWVRAEEENTNYQLQWSQSVVFSIIETNTGRVWIYGLPNKKPKYSLDKPGEELKEPEFTFLKDSQ